MQVIKNVRVAQTEEWITQVKQTLQDFRNNNPPDSIWRNTYLLSNMRMSSDPYEKLQYIMKAIIVANLQSAREIAGIRQHNNFVNVNQFHLKDVYKSIHELEKQLKLDMGDDRYPELKQWSVLYHFYFVAPKLKLSYIAQHAYRVVRQIRNYRTDGIKLLIQGLIQEEETHVNILQQQVTLRAKSLVERRAENMINEARVARELDNERDALSLSDKAVKFAQDNQLPRYYVMAASVKIFCMLQGDVNSVTAAAEFLFDVETSALIKQLRPSPDLWWIMTKIHSMWAHLWRRSGDLKNACLSADQAVTYLGQLAYVDKELVKDTYLIYGLMYWASGQYQQAQMAFEEAINSGHEDLYDVHEMLGLTYWSQSQYDFAESHFNQAIAQSTEQQNNWHLANQKGNLALVYLSRGQLNISQQYIEDHLQIAEKLDSMKERERASANLGLVLMHRGNLSDARHFLEEAHHRYQTMSSPMSMLLITLTLSQLNTLNKDHETALKLARSVQQYAERQADVYIPKLLVYRCLGGCELLEKTERIHYLETAIKIAREHRPFDVAACEWGLAVLHPSPTKRFEYWKSSSNTLQKLGASRWFRRFQNAYPHLPILS